ncbi:MULTISPECIES: peptidoglycan-binding domain-containing protein [unclassified Luteimonas]
MSEKAMGAARNTSAAVRHISPTIKTTGRGLDDYITADNADYQNARRIVNGTDRAADIAALARAREPDVADLVTSVQRDGVDLTPVPATREADAPLQRGDANARAFELQQYLSALNITHAAGRPLSADGDFGPSTERAVLSYQDMAGIAPRTGTVDQALFDQIRGEVLRADPNFRLKTIMDLYGPLNDRVLDPGDRGDAVADLQEQLSGLGYRGSDGQFLRISRRYDADTQAAVRRFQGDENIVPESGLADEQTRDAINARAVERDLPEAVEVIRRREEAQNAQQPRQEPAQEGNGPVEDRQGMLQPQTGPFNDPFVDRYLAAVMAGDSDLADRSLDQQQALEQQQLEERQRAQPGPVMQM